MSSHDRRCRCGLCGIWSAIRRIKERLDALESEFKVSPVLTISQSFEETRQTHERVKDAKSIPDPEFDWAKVNADIGEATIHEDGRLLAYRFAPVQAPLAVEEDVPTIVESSN